MSVSMLIGLNLNYLYFKCKSLQTNTIYPNNTLKEEKKEYVLQNNNNNNILLTNDIHKMHKGNYSIN